MSVIKDNLDRLLAEAPVTAIDDSDRLVILSDFHMGDGGARDDFLPNSALCMAVLREHYLPRGARLVLNGDVEELQRTPYRRIHDRWAALYSIFDAFRSGAGLLKLVGNHDEGVPGALPSARFAYRSDTVFVFHGHQATTLYRSYNEPIAFLLKYIAHPLGIGNHSVSRDSGKRFKIERRVYRFSSANHVLSIIGHTHRPLFESMSKADSLKFKVEQLCRLYPETSASEQVGLERAIGRLKIELRRVLEKHHGERTRGSLYDWGLHVPCIFNSGCVIGKSGLTAIEIEEGRIRLVHWFDEARNSRYLEDDGGDSPLRLPGTGYWRVVLKEDSLRYMFTRIRLLADVEVPSGRSPDMATPHGPG